MTAATRAPAQVLLDWRDRDHYSARKAPCRRCGRGALMRDDAGAPCHKTCAEAELTDAGVTTMPPVRGARPASRRRNGATSDDHD